MACGTPVVAARAASIPEVTGDAALLVDPLYVDPLAGALSSVLCDDALVTDLRERGPTRAALFSWSEMAAALDAHL